MDIDKLQREFEENERKRIEATGKLDKLTVKGLETGTLAHDEAVFRQAEEVNRLVLTSQRLEKMLEELSE